MDGKRIIAHCAGDTPNGEEAQGEGDTLGEFSSASSHFG